MNNYDLLVIGNGCDINLGYKTKYGDFLTSINIAYKHENFNNYQNFMKEAQKIDVDIEYYNSCIKLKNNFFVYYFLTKNNISHNWCNVESELENIVLELDRLLTNMKIYDGVSYILDNKIIENTFIIEAINNSGWGYINCSNQNVRNMIFKEIDKTVETNPIIKKERKEEFIKRIAISLYTDLIGLKNLLKKYLVCATNAKPSKQLNNGKYELVTYNYTNIFEKHYSNNCREIYHIHGSVMDEIVLGIDSKVEFNNEVFNMFDKSIQRTELNENGYSLEDFVINSQDIGYIGLSFDENDYTSMFQILSYEGSKHTVFYYNNEDRINKANNIKKILGYEVFNDMMNKNKLVFENINRILIA